MNVKRKLEILGAAAKYDACAASGDGCSGRGICHASLPDGRCISLLKVLFTNRCIHDCRYCVNTACTERAEFEPRELAELTVQLYLRNYVEGLFLSSGVGSDPDVTTEKMVECVSLLRGRGFDGYIHLKLLPGVSRHYVKQLSRLADRVSLNIEAPSKSRFSELTSTKEFETDVLRRLRWLSKERPPSGITTQFVVGAAEETDLEILKATDQLYSRFHLRRSYFSAFSPVSGTELADGKKTPLVREHRLYQSDWLMRVYRFPFSEIKGALDGEGFLPLSADPKTLLAQGMEPVDPRSADYERLLRVPGIGPGLARRILKKRGGSLSMRRLRELGVSRKAMPFLSLGHRQVRL